MFEDSSGLLGAWLWRAVNHDVLWGDVVWNSVRWSSMQWLRVSEDRWCQVGKEGQCGWAGVVLGWVGWASVG